LFTLTIFTFTHYVASHEDKPRPGIEVNLWLKCPQIVVSSCHLHKYKPTAAFLVLLSCITSDTVSQC